MRVGIVGSEAAKFTAASEAVARQVIRAQIAGASLVVSGACHLGGIDVWAVEEAKGLGILTVEFRPSELNWSRGYRTRNIQIAQHSDRIVCITVDRLPEGYIGMQFEKCYHCGTDQHVKSGGCWTVKYGRAIGREGDVIVIPQDQQPDQPTVRL